MLIIARHGRTDENARGVLLGRLDPDLDDLGHRQARAMADALGPVSRVVSSPLARTRQTADAFGLPVETDDRLIELDYGDFDGKAPGELPDGTWDRWRADIDFAPPGGESLADLAARVSPALDEHAYRAADEVVVLVTHVSPIKAALAWTLGVGIEVSWRSYVTPASLMRVAVARGSRSLVSFNETSHLLALL